MSRLPNTPFLGKEDTCWEGSFGVPWYIRWPSVIKIGSVYSEFFFPRISCPPLWPRRANPIELHRHRPVAVRAPATPEIMELLGSIVERSVEATEQHCRQSKRFTGGQSIVGSQSFNLSDSKTASFIGSICTHQLPDRRI